MEIRILDNQTYREVNHVIYTSKRLNNATHHVNAFIYSEDWKEIKECNYALSISGHLDDYVEESSFEKAREAIDEFIYANKSLFDADCSYTFELVSDGEWEDVFWNSYYSVKAVYKSWIEELEG